MATAPTYPGVYIEEVPSGVRTITGVATSITAFVGFATRGPVNEPRLVQSFAEFERVFGGLSALSTMSYAVLQYFLNGGRDALIVRTAHLTGTGTNASKGSVDVGGTGSQKLTLEAASEGAWCGSLLIRIDQETSDKDASTPKLFNLSIKDTGTGVVETLRNLPPNTSLAALIEQQSSLVRATGLPTQRPDKDADVAPGEDPFDPAHTDRYKAMPAGEDGDQAEADLVPATDTGTGVFALARADLFNLLCIPPSCPRATGRRAGGGLRRQGRAAKFCADHRALFVVDPHPDWTLPAQIATGGARHVHHGHRLRRPGERGDLLPADSARPTRSRAAEWSSSRRAARSPGSWPGRTRPRRLEGAGGTRRRPLRGAGARGRTHRRRERQLNPLGVNCLRTFPVDRDTSSGARGRWTGPTRSPPSGSTCRCGGSRSSSRRASTAARNGSCSSRTTSRSGRRSGSTSARSCRTSSARARSRARRPARRTS